MSKTAVFRCDAGPEIGTGHVVRCLALADELSRRGWNCLFVCLPGTRAVVESFREVSHRIIEVAGADDPIVMRKVTELGACDLAVVDSYRLGAIFERGLAGWAATRLVIDDIPTRPHECEWLLDQTFEREVTEYECFLGPHTCVLAGTDYALLHPAFAAARPQALARREGTVLKRILVAFGGTPSTSLLHKVIHEIRQSGVDATIDIVTGSTEFHHPSDDQSVTVHGPTGSIHILMAECDLAIGAPGTSAWERCCLGLPTLMIQVADNQREIASKIAKANAGINLGSASDLASGALARSIGLMAREPEHLRNMAKQAAMVCDGLGVRRVAATLSPRRTRDGASVILRPVQDRDAAMLFKWQQIPGIRRHSPNTQPPNWEEHVEWFDSRIADVFAGPFSVIESEGIPTGMLRLDRIRPNFPGSPFPDKAYVISILLDPAYQGTGIASTALLAAADLLPGTLLVAEVLPANEASHRLFQKARYGLVAEGIYAYLAPAKVNH